MRRHLLLLPVLLLYLALGVLYVRLTPAWQAPDEPAHYNYVRQLAGGELPVMEPGDWDQTYLETIVGARFDPAYSIDQITYEDWQPPLYYLLQTPIFLLGGGSLTALRLMSLLLGAVVVSLAYTTGRVLFPRATWLALAAAVFVAFLPQHLAILSSVNNDSLAEVLIAAILLALVVPWPARPPRYRLLVLGILLGLGFLTKASVYLMAPVIGLVVLIRYWAQWREMVSALLWVFGPALILGSLWWIRNAAVYGDLDFLASQTHGEVVVGQPRTAEWVAQLGLSETVQRFLQTSFNSFWGQFGWMAAPLPSWAYGLLALLSLLALVGFGLALVTRPPVTADRRNEWIPFVALATTLMFTVSGHVGYNIAFVQHQGRYLFPALIPLSLGLAVGLGIWLRPILKRWPAAGYLLPLGLALMLVPLSLYALSEIIVPYLSPT